MNIKRSVLLFCGLGLCLCLLACKANTGGGSETEIFKTVYKQDKNYEILSDDDLTAFHYFVKDHNGYMIDEGYHDARGSFDIDQKGTFVILDYGYGGNARLQRYYDVSNGRVSRFFERPVASSGELVAYFSVNGDDQIVLVVQNMFDPDKYYKEIIRDFSDFVLKDEAKAAFSENNTKLSIAYWTGPDNEWVSEMIDL